jgi:hypothetical protein
MLIAISTVRETMKLNDQEHAGFRKKRTLLGSWS